MFVCVLIYDSFSNSKYIVSHISRFFASCALLLLQRKNDWYIIDNCVVYDCLKIRTISADEKKGN